jgi:proline iminopeptidase
MGVCSLGPHPEEIIRLINIRMNTSRLFVDKEFIGKAGKDDWANAFARIENHYFVNEGFMRQGQLLESQEIDKMYGVSTLKYKLT